MRRRISRTRNIASNRKANRTSSFCRAGRVLARGLLRPFILRMLFVRATRTSNVKDCRESIGSVEISKNLIASDAWMLDSHAIQSYFVHSLRFPRRSRPPARELIANSGDGRPHFFAARHRGCPRERKQQMIACTGRTERYISFLADRRTKMDRRRNED